MTTIAHATNLTPADQASFAHAVALARSGDAELVSVHAVHGEAKVVMPDPGSLLTGWGQTAEAIRHRSMVHTCCDDPVDTVLDALRRIEPDLVVAATGGRSGLARLLLPSRAEGIANNTSVPSLLLPTDCRGIVDSRDGSLMLRRMLLPVEDLDTARQAVAAAVAFGQLAGVVELTMVLLHVNDPAHEEALRSIELPTGVPAGWKLLFESAEGELEDEIARAAQEACLLVMATHGHDSIRDVLFGSHTERVLHRVHCPVLWVPLED